METMIQTPWLDARAAAAYIGRKSQNAYKSIIRMARQGRIRSGHDGKAFRFRVEDLDAWLYLNAKKAAR